MKRGENEGMFFALLFVEVQARFKIKEVVVTKPKKILAPTDLSKIHSRRFVTRWRSGWSRVRK